MFIPIRDDNPYHRFPALTVGLIAVNVYVFFAVGVTQESVIRYGAIPCDVLGTCEALSVQIESAFPDRSPLVSVFTSMFMHGNFLHLAFNMLFLWIFGNNVEDRLGHIRFIAFYFLTGVAAAAAHFALFADSTVPVVGASGAVSGILGAYLLLWPTARVVSVVMLGIIPIPIELPAWFMLGFWFVLQVLGGLAGLGLGEEAGTAFFAHVGGFVAGMALIGVFAPRRRRRPRDLADRISP